MKSIEKTNTSDVGKGKITFKDYYDSLPSFVTPKKEFIDEICRRCEVNESTVRNWVALRSRPQKESHYLILSELTGIEPENLFAE